MSSFFLLGALVALLVCIALLAPGGPLEFLWRLNPQAGAGFEQIGPGAIPLMAVVAAACAAAGVGLAAGASWGHRLALGVLVVNLCGDLANAVVRGDLRTLIGIPIGGFLIGYLLSRRVRSYVAAARLRPTERA